MKRVFVILLCSLLVMSTAGCTSDMPQPTEATTMPTVTEPVVITDEVRQQMDEIQKEHLFEGIVCLTHNGEVVYASVTGTNDMGDPLTMESPMFMNSVSKQFCATAILMLRDQGKLRLDDTLDKYFPAYALGKDITLRNLLTMRSGIVGDFEVVLDNPAQYEDLAAQEINAAALEWLFVQPLNFAPDTRYEYSNVNYTLLSLVVEQVSGMVYEDFIRQSIFEPLGMTHSGFMCQVEENADWGLTYENIRPGCWYAGLCQGCGDIVSTARDMEIWMTALQGGQVICEESYREMTTSYSGNVAYQGYGYGLMLCPRDGWGHGGGNLAYTNFVYFNREHGYNLFVATSNTPAFYPTQSGMVTTDLLTILFKAIDAVAQ